MDLHKKVREQDRIDFIRHISHFFTELQGRVNSKSATMRSTLTNLDERFDDQIEEIDELNHRSSQFLFHFARMVELTAAKFRKQAHLCQQERELLSPSYSYVNKIIRDCFVMYQNSGKML
eukprot:TRINITY_DN6211_c0_g1_i1.p1 TRINITY_DN6211_c0_g1~~TRINITY_DN6211_c0_g1_i1.p1  ORF type:complete len:120 (-),score=23.39 TRINITY_DN6211_c0_g1_i1:200-559(-)